MTRVEGLCRLAAKQDVCVLSQTEPCGSVGSRSQRLELTDSVQEGKADAERSKYADCAAMSGARGRNECLLLSRVFAASL